MKIKKTLMLILSVMILFMPIIASAKCEDYSASNCPENSCKVEGDSCVETYIGDGFCEETNVKNALKSVGYFILIAKLIIPFLIVGFGIFDLVKAVTAGEPSDKINKQLKTLGIRVMIGMLVFALPTIVDAILNGVNGLSGEESDYSKCQTCLLKPFDCVDPVYPQLYMCTINHSCVYVQSESEYNTLIERGICPESAFQPLAEEEKSKCSMWYERTTTSKNTLYMCVTSNTCMDIPDKATYDKIINDGVCQGWALQEVKDSTKCQGMSTTTTTTSFQCSNYHDYESCERTGRCDWDSTNNRCNIHPVPTTSTASTSDLYLCDQYPGSAFC